MAEEISPELNAALKAHKEQMNIYYAQLIANPYTAQTTINDIRIEVLIDSTSNPRALSHAM